MPLQQQPFEVLRALVEQPGDVVTRETLRRRLWPDGTIVDFDQSLNKSLTKLRDALGDSASNPRFVQTLPKRGYRFIAPVSEVLPAVPAPVPESAPAQARAADPADVTALPQRTLPALWPWVAFAAVALILGLLAVASSTRARVDRPAEPGAAGPAVGAPEGTPIAAARDAYERGRRAFARGSERCIRQSVDLFRRAVELSPRYAAAYAALAQAYLSMASGASDETDLVAQAREAAARAVAISPDLAAGYTALGRLALAHDRDWRLAEAHLQRAVRLDPGNADARSWYAAALSEAGRNEDAEAEARRALAADPHALETNTAMGAVLYRAGRHAEAAMALARAVEIDPDYAPARRLMEELAGPARNAQRVLADLAK